MVNNGAAALVLATTALAAGREVVISRGELVEIGDGFRLPDLITSAGARIREVGHHQPHPSARLPEAVGADTGCILKVHPSNFRIERLHARRRRSTSWPGSARRSWSTSAAGLLAPDPLLPDEPDADYGTAATAPAVVTAAATSCSAVRRPGCCWAGPDVIERLRRHPLARALRVDKLTLAALEATLRGPATPVTWRAARRRDGAAVLGPRAWPARLSGGGRPSGAGRGRRRRRRRARAAAAGLGGRAARRALRARRLRAAAILRWSAGSSAALLLDLRCVRPRRRRPPVRRRGVRHAAAGGPDGARRRHRRARRPRKSTLVRALTGMEPDRWAEERRRGMTIDLGLRLDDAAGRRGRRLRRRAGSREVHRHHAGRRSARRRP